MTFWFPEIRKIPCFWLNKMEENLVETFVVQESQLAGKDSLEFRQIGLEIVFVQILQVLRGLFQNNEVVSRRALTNF
jgi:hypothetical protein